MTPSEEAEIVSRIVYAYRLCMYGASSLCDQERIALFEDHLDSILKRIEKTQRCYFCKEDEE